jgi:DNA-binding SARP family transcriptional activator
MRGIARVQTASEPVAAPQGARRLSISLVGRLALRIDGRAVELRTRKAAAVLGYLALSESKRESRERLVGLLWSRSDEEKARASLRQVVRELRQVLEDAGFAGFSAERLTLGFDHGQVEVDIESVLQQAESGRIHPLLLDAPRLDERLLDGMDDLDPSFRVWILAKRQTINERLMRSLEAALTAADAAGEPGRAIATAVVNLDPTHELACCCLMQAHAEDGDIAGALRIYKALWELLDRDYGMEPSKPTQDLVAKIKLGEFETSADRRVRSARTEPVIVRNNDARHNSAAGPSRSPAKPRLLLSPFAMHGIDTGRAHLVQGFGLHLAASLVRFREWSVIDRPATSVAPALLDDVPQYCIETTAYQAGAEINMVMVLRDETSGVLIWSESIRLDLNNWFETQQRIIRRIATSLNVQLSAERLRRLAGEPDVSLDLYDRWLRGQSLIAKFDPESWRRAVVIFRDAIRDNPTFSPCYSSLVQIHNVEHFVHPGMFLDPGKARETLGLAKIAVQLDPVDSRAHLCCGWSHVLVQREADAAPHMELACELNDNDPWTLLSTAAYYAFCGSTERARLRAEQAFAVSPVPSYLEWGYYSIIQFLCGDYSGAIEAGDRAQGVIKTLSGWRAAALYHLGHREMAQQEAQRFLNGTRSFWVGADAPTDEALTRWLLQAHPIRVTERWEALRDGLRGAGLPVEGIVQPAR